MRMYVLLIFAAIFLSFSTAYYAINMQKKTLAGPAEILEITRYKKEFEQKVRSFIEIDLSAMYPTRRYSQLLQPQNSFAREGSATKAYFSRSCALVTEKMSKLYSDKSEIWEDFLCNRISKLPVNFFDNSPFLHENGVSYAFLAFLSGREPFYTHEWVRSNLNLFHVYELEELPPASLEGNFKILSRLKKFDLEGLVKGNKYVLSDNYFLIRDIQDPNVSYKVFTKEEFENFLKEKVYYIRPLQEGEQCFYREGHFCLEKDTRTLVQLFMQSSIIVFSGSVIVLLLIAVILFRKIKQQKFEEERKKHALRVLTHELRTPIANLLLQVERINKESDMIPASVLEEFLKMEGEVYRLKRLAEKSTSYLQTHDGNSLLFISVQHVSSVNDLLMDMVHDYLEKGVRCIPAARDAAFDLDVYWFGICVKNLLENALHHGKKPVMVNWTVSAEDLVFTVVDAGVCPYKNLDELLSLDKRDGHSSGLGLGMNIVQKIMKEMDGKLSFSNDPTTFSLFLRNKK
jgi:signal transduction histidine kinase